MTTPTIDLRLGPWQTSLADVDQVDAVICDPPYGARTHAGHNDGVEGARFKGEEKRMRVDKRNGSVYSVGVSRRKTIDYDAFTPADVAEFVASVAPRCRGWFVACTSHDLIPAWISAYEAAGRCAFAPVIVIQHRPRLSGDGPGNAAVYLMVSRPRSREFSTWGSLPGWYHSRPERGAIVAGAKPLDLMRQIVRDYTKPGDLVCDPFAGGATTLIAAEREGRRAVGSELDLDTYIAADQRITAQTAQIDLLAELGRGSE